MSVVRQDPDLIEFVNKLECQVFLLIEENKELKKRVTVLEKAAKRHGVEISSESVTTDTCIIT
jgi:hypothetical protein